MGRVFLFLLSSLFLVLISFAYYYPSAFDGVPNPPLSLEHPSQELTVPTLRPTDNAVLLPITPKPALSPLNLFSKLVKNKRLVILQADNRLNWLYYPAQSSNYTTAPPVFADNIVGPSIWSTFRYALIHNASYVFMAAPSSVMGPKAKQTFGHYWAKIPAILYLLHLLKGTRVEYLLFLDSDMSPADEHVSIDDYLSSLVKGLGQKRVDRAHIFVNNDDGSYYSALLANARVYQAQGPLNSGSILLRNSAQALALIERLWFNLTTIKSPYEMSFEKTTLHLTWTNGDDKSASDAYDIIFAAFKKIAGPLSLVSDPLLNDASKRKQDSMVLTLQPYPDQSEKSFAQMRARCCGRANCFAGQLPPSISHVRVRCVDAKSKSTLYGTWPGDQDRLNWLRDMDVDGDFLAAARSAKLHMSSCKPKGSLLFMHWCADYWAKLKFSRKAAALLPVHNASRPFEPWLVLKRLVPAFKLPMESESLPTTDIIKDFVLQGKFEWVGGTL